MKILLKKVENSNFLKLLLYHRFNTAVYFTTILNGPSYLGMHKHVFSLIAFSLMSFHRSTIDQIFILLKFSRNLGSTLKMATFFCGTRKSASITVSGSFARVRHWRPSAAGDQASVYSCSELCASAITSELLRGVYSHYFPL